jgi:hypothetical protein
MMREMKMKTLMRMKRRVGMKTRREMKKIAVERTPPPSWEPVVNRHNQIRAAI